MYIYIYVNSLLETLLFSDNNDRILIDLSSASSTSESDNNTKSIHYISKTDQSGGTKLTKAQQRKKNQELKILCNKKIYYFLEKYAKTSAGKCFIL